MKFLADVAALTLLLSLSFHWLLAVGFTMQQLWLVFADGNMLAATGIIVGLSALLALGACALLRIFGK
jgi:hypothetical protein